MMGTTRRLGLAGGGIFRDLEGFLKIVVNVFKVSCLLVTEKLETWKSFVTSDPEAFVCNVLMPPHSINQHFYPKSSIP